MMFQIGKKQIIKNTALPCFLLCIICLGFRPQTRRKGLFEKNPLESQKLSKIKWCILSRVLWHTFLRKKGVCGFSRGFFKSSLKQGPHTQFQHIMKNKKSTAMPCFFYALNVGASPQTLTQRTFREKSFGISKAFAQIN